MNQTELKKTIDLLSEQIKAIADEKMKPLLESLFNLIEMLVADNVRLREENQKLRDENNILKGEQGKPNIRKQSNGDLDHSSEKERKPKIMAINKKSKKKKNKIKIDRVERCAIDKNLLPEDAEFKGYHSVVVQDLSFKTDNIEFQKEHYYSASLGKTFTAQLPKGYSGEFGPVVKSFILDLRSSCKMTVSAIGLLLKNLGILISEATISRFLTDRNSVFHQEKQDIRMAGLLSSSYQQMDDTSARVKGKNYYTHVLCNPCYTVFCTRRNKDRMTIIEILTQGEMKFHLNEASLALMTQMKLSEKQMTKLKAKMSQEVLSCSEMNLLLDTLFPKKGKNEFSRRIILECAAILAYQQLPYAIPLLLTDDAPQFRKISKLLGLCWVHDGRHYKKLSPVFSSHKKQIIEFLDRYWDFYHKLLNYKKEPSLGLKGTIEKDFDLLFSTVTGYQQLDLRIQKTLAKKEALLLVLEHPEIPLHNNASELGARVQARYRDISLHTMSEAGTQAKDTFMSIVETAKKCRVNTYRYFLDRISKKYEMPSLASLIASSGAYSAG